VFDFKRALLLAVAVAGVLAPAAVAGAVTPAANPFAGARLFTDPGSPAAVERDAAALRGDATSAAALDRIASTPQATWFIAADDPAGSGYVRSWFGRLDAAGAGTVPVIALHGLPDQVCAGENAAGARDGAAYQAWIAAWADALRGRRAIVVVEPDGLAASRCMARAARASRRALVRSAAATLAAVPGVAVYLDIGAGDWLPLRLAAAYLRAAGIAGVRGFTLNSTHYDWTTDEVRYGERLSRLTGGARYVVNTAFNGRGPQVRRGFHVWCNPRGRALGPLPTTKTHAPHADAFFWLGNPGLSDGHCNGGPQVGTFWTEWALELSANALGARDFPIWHPPRAAPRRKRARRTAARAEPPRPLRQPTAGAGSRLRARGAGRRFWVMHLDRPVRTATQRTRESLTPTARRSHGETTRNAFLMSCGSDDVRFPEMSG
jgi:endoglucanase